MQKYYAVQEHVFMSVYETSSNGTRQVQRRDREAAECVLSTSHWTSSQPTIDKPKGEAALNATLDKLKGDLGEAAKQPSVCVHRRTRQAHKRLDKLEGEAAMRPSVRVQRHIHKPVICEPNRNQINHV